MRKHLKEIIILILIFAFIVVGSYTFFYFRYIKPNLYTVAFQDVDGVIIGSPVHFMGLTIGHVRHLKIRDNMVIVEIIVTHPSVKIPMGSTIQVEFSGMGGSKSMEVRTPSKSSDKTLSLKSEKPIRLADVFKFNKIYAISMMAFEHDIKEVSPEQIQSAVENIPRDYDFSSVNSAINSAEKNISNVSNKMQGVFKKEEQTGETIDAITDFLKKIPYGKGDKSK